ncbi:DUF551 domain-containing protein [Salmonella enterica]|nr:DUF551 domain-containing protein [Salmonella enterica]
MADAVKVIDEVLERRNADIPPVHPTIAHEKLDDETLQELIDFRRSTFEYHSKEGHEVQTIIHGVVLSAMLELHERRAAMLQSGNSPVATDGLIPVSERMPYVGKRLALYGRRVKEDCAHYVDEGYLGSNGFFYFFDWEGGPRIDDCHNDDKATVTHWMYWELPAAPQQEVKSALEHGMQRYAGAMQKLSEGDK